MNYSNGLEYIVGNSYSHNSYSKILYFSKNTDDNYGIGGEEPVIFVPPYRTKTQNPYKHPQQSTNDYTTNHELTPEVFLKPSRLRTRLVVDNNEAKNIAEEIFELMMPSKVKDFCGTENPKDFPVKEKLPEDISINVLPFDEFKALHSSFGAWSNGILGFSINGNEKKIFVRENHLDSLIIVLGHEIGHVLTEQLPNKHDEETKAFAFSIEWAKTIKEHNIAGLGINIKDDIDFKPARNGLHDVAFAFVDFMVKRGRRAIEIHDDLVKRYVSLLNPLYPK